MNRHSKIIFIGILILISILISFPFFAIKYFEPLPILKLLYHNFFYPILIIASITTVVTYFKYLRKFNKKTHSKIKVALQDFFSVTFLTCIFAVILLALIFSVIVTSNAYLGSSEVLLIKERVIKYEPYITKWGRLRHYIEFINPTNNKIIRLEVYRKYNIDETFIKEMKIGKWGQLYSFD